MRATAPATAPTSRKLLPYLLTALAVLVLATLAAATAKLRSL